MIEEPKKWLYPYSYWTSLENQRKFLEKVKQKCGIKDPSDWGKLSMQDIEREGLSILLTSYYHTSLFNCLKAVYQGSLSAYYRFDNVEIDWKKEWFPSHASFPHNYWKSLKNQRKFLEEMKIKFHIRQPRDWGKIITRHFNEMGGASLLPRYYNGSLFNCLKSVYKGYLLHSISN